MDTLANKLHLMGRHFATTRQDEARREGDEAATLRIRREKKHETHVECNKNAKNATKTRGKKGRANGWGAQKGEVWKLRACFFAFLEQRSKEATTNVTGQREREKHARNMPWKRIRKA